MDIKVLTFDKRFYQKDELSLFNDKEKYYIATEDKENCSVMDIKEYERLLNDSYPLEKYVYTYFVIVFDPDD